MPSQPAWFHRLDEILADLRAMKSTHLDRLRRLGDLSAGIALRSGELRVVFSGAGEKGPKSHDLRWPRPIVKCSLRHSVPTARLSMSLTA